MDDTGLSAQGGTAESGAGSQADEQTGVATTGAEGAGAASEPTVEIDGKQVPLSRVRTALKNDEHFTNDRQKLAKEREALEAERAAIGATGLSAEHAMRLARALENPDVHEAVAGIAPDLARELPKPSQVTESRYLAENLQLKFDRFADKHPEFDADQQLGIRTEALRLAKSGRFDDALDFESIGLRLYKDTVIAHEAQKRIDAEKRAAKEKEEAQRRAATAPAGMPQIRGNLDPSKLRGASRLALGHAAQTRKK